MSIYIFAGGVALERKGLLPLDMVMDLPPTTFGWGPSKTTLTCSLEPCLSVDFEQKYSQTSIITSSSSAANQRYN